MPQDDAAFQLVSVEEKISTVDGRTQTGTKLVFHREPFEELVKQVKNLKVAIISIAGPFRTGKGFVLSLFVHFLNWMTNGAKGPWLKEGEKLKSFKWRSGSAGDTEGIYMYSKPFLYEKPCGEKIAILLMDTQGTCDTRKTGKETSTIFALSTMISSLQIYNLMKNIDMPTLEHLAFFTKVAAIARREATTDHIFQELFFLIRDWACPKEKPYGKESGNQLINQVLEEDKKSNIELGEICNELYRMFEKVNGFLLPSPGEGVATDNDNNKTISEEFLNYIREFFRLILDKLQEKKIGEVSIIGDNLMDLMEQYIPAFEDDTLPEPVSMFKAQATVSYRNAETYAAKFYQEIEEVHGRCAGIALLEFDNKLKFGNKEIGDEYRKQLFNFFDEQLKLLLNDFKEGGQEKVMYRLAVAAVMFGVVALPALGIIKKETLMAVVNIAGNLMVLNQQLPRRQ